MSTRSKCSAFLLQILVETLPWTVSAVASVGGFAPGFVAIEDLHSAGHWHMPRQDLPVSDVLIDRLPLNQIETALGPWNQLQPLRLLTYPLIQRSESHGQRQKSARVVS